MRRETTNATCSFAMHLWDRVGIFTVALLLAGAGLPHTARADVLAEDYGSNYGAGWTHGSNGGSGFTPWQFAIDPGDAAVTIGNPADAGITGMATNSFGLGGTTSYANARRGFATPLKIGDTFSLQWGNNWDTGRGYKGLNLYSLGKQILNIHMGASQTITLQPQDQPSQPMFTNYGTAAITLNFEYTAANTLRVHATGRDGNETFDQVFTVSGAPDGFQIFAGELAATDLANRIPYVNNLIIEGDLVPELVPAGKEGMVVGQTNRLVVSRTGPTASPLTVNLQSDDPAILVVRDASVTIPAGETEAVTEVVGTGRGSATLTISAEAFSNLQVDIEVYDLAYDSSSYYTPGSWTNGSNGGAGFGAWFLENNDGDQGGSVTNYAGVFLGDSTIYGGGDVNTPALNAFGLYANSSESGGTPYSEATRFLPAFPVGGQLTFDLGVNYRNGAKGAVLQRGGTWLFEVAVVNDEYVYADWGNNAAGFTSLDWPYAADTALNVEITRVGTDRYDVVITRSGAIHAMAIIETSWPGLGGYSPDQIRFHVHDTDRGGQNNLYVNRLGMNHFHYLEMEGVVNINVGGTTKVYLRRSDTTGPLTVNLASASAGVATVPATVDFADGVAVTDFEVTGVSESLVHISASAPGYVGRALLVDVFPFPEEWDNAGNYIPGQITAGTFLNGANAGGGFGPWAFNTPGDAVVDLGSFLVPEVWFDSANSCSFRLLGESADYAEAGRALNTPLAPGDKFEALLGVNWSGGHRGMDIFDAADNLLFNFNLSDGDTYTYTFGPNPGIHLGWAYDNNSAILVEIEQQADNQLSVTLTRNDGSTTNVVSGNLAAPVAKVVFYNGGHDGDTRQALFVNDLLITRKRDKGPPVQSISVSAENIGGTDYLRATVDMGIGESGATYALEYTTDLQAEPVVWTPAGSPLVGDGVSSILLQNDNDADPKRFYRVVITFP